MLSNLASYIFGASSSEVSSSPSPSSDGLSSPLVRQASQSTSEEEGWVLVGTPSHDLNLGSIHDIPGSLLSSGGEEDEDEEEVNNESGSPEESRLPSSRSPANNLQPGSNLAISRSKAIAAAQTALQKKTKKALSGKMLERQNKAVKISGSCKKMAGKHSFAIKSSGINKQLKQC